MASNIRAAIPVEAPARKNFSSISFDPPRFTLACPRNSPSGIDPHYAVSNAWLLRRNLRHEPILVLFFFVLGKLLGGQCRCLFSYPVSDSDEQLRKEFDLAPIRIP